MPDHSRLNQVGEIVAVLNKLQLLVRSSADLTPEQQLLVYERVPFANVPEGIDLTHLDFPKGFVEVQAHQGGPFYICGVFRNVESRRKRKLAPYQILMGVTEEIEEKVPGPWSGSISEKDSLRIEAKSSIMSGDLVASEW